MNEKDFSICYEVKVTMSTEADSESKKKRRLFSRDKKEEGEEKAKRKLVWDPSDGLQWQDFVGLILALFIFIWRVIKLIFSPFFWAIDENVKMYRFAKQSDTERLMSEEEQKFFESLPFVFMVSGLSGGVVLGIFVAFSLKDFIEQFLANLNLEGLFNLIVDIIRFIYNAIVWVITLIADIASALFDFVVGLFTQNPFVALGGLFLLTFVAVIVFIVLNETEVFAKIKRILIRITEAIVGSPDRFKLKVGSFYRKFNHSLTVLLIGSERLTKRKLKYFKTVAFYTLLTSFLTYIEGIVVAFKFTNQIKDALVIIGYFAFYLLVAGIGTGWIAFAFYARFLDLLSRKKYIYKEEDAAKEKETNKDAEKEMETNKEKEMEKEEKS